MLIMFIFENKKKVDKITEKNIVNITFLYESEFARKNMHNAPNFIQNK